jgi:hypothetical protein
VASVAFPTTVSTSRKKAFGLASLHAEKHRYVRPSRSLTSTLFLP